MLALLIMLLGAIAYFASVCAAFHLARRRYPALGREVWLDMSVSGPLFLLCELAMSAARKFGG